MPQQLTHDPQILRRERQDLLRQLNQLTDKPLVILSFVWLGLLVLDFTQGLSPALQMLSQVIWSIFIVDFVLEFAIAPHKGKYLKENWLTALSLLLPAFRIVRAFRALRLLRLTRATRSLGLLRLITSLNRGMRSLSHMLGRRGLGFVLALTAIVIVAGAAAIFTFENPRALKDAGVLQTGSGDRNGLTSYGEALWWTAMIMTTLGSEYWPQTTEGRLLTFFLSLYAFAVFGYITANLASFFVGQDKKP